MRLVNATASAAATKHAGLNVGDLGLLIAGGVSHRDGRSGKRLISYLHEVVVRFCLGRVLRLAEPCLLLWLVGGVMEMMILRLLRDSLMVVSLLIRLTTIKCLILTRLLRDVRVSGHPVLRLEVVLLHLICCAGE